MTKEEVVEANKMFAEYLGYKYFPKIDNEQNPGWRRDLKRFPKSRFNWYLCRNHNQLPFDKDWNWFMKVFKKSKESDYEYCPELLRANLKGAFKNLYNHLKNLNNE